MTTDGHIGETTDHAPRHADATGQPLTIIIPAINERDTLQCLVTDIQRQRGVQPAIIIADGGSTDGTQAYAQTHHIDWVVCAPGRGKQMNQAAATVSSGLLLFLHADTRLPTRNTLEQALAHYRAQKKTLENSRPGSQHTGKPLADRVLAGHFPIRFARQNQHRHDFFWRYVEEKTETNRPDTINGDQGLLISKTDFINLGGFDETWHFLEDQKLSEKIFQRGHWILLPTPIVTSARRFETEGTYQLYLLMAIMMGLYKTGFPDFFEQAPALYRQQKDTSTLQLTPFFKRIWHIKINTLGLKGSIIAWYRVGRYINGHAWQVFYGIDQLCRPLYRRKRYPCLWLYDHCLHRLIHNPLVSAMVMVLAFVNLMGILFPILWLTEWPQRHVKATAGHEP